MKYFRVKIGFDNDDFISVDETELAMAIRAQITGKIGVFKEGTVRGTQILSIIPDFQREMNYNRDYKLRSEDYKEIGTQRVNESRVLIENTKKQISLQFRSSSPLGLSTGVLDNNKQRE